MVDPYCSKEAEERSMAEDFYPFVDNGLGPDGTDDATQISPQGTAPAAAADPDAHRGVRRHAHAAARRDGRAV